MGEETKFFTNLWRVKLGDIGRALIIAIITAPVGIVYEWATVENFELSGKALLKGAIAGGLAYLIKNFITGANGKILTNK